MPVKKKKHVKFDLEETQDAEESKSEIGDFKNKSSSGGRKGTDSSVSNEGKPKKKVSELRMTRRNMRKQRELLREFERKTSEARVMAQEIAQ